MGLSIAGLKQGSFSLFFNRRNQIEPNNADQTDVSSATRKRRTTAA
jgi:hypothetical protein